MKIKIAKINKLFRYIILFFICYYSINANSQISNLIPENKLPPKTSIYPDGGYTHWIRAGTIILKTENKIYVNECINVLNHGLINDGVTDNSNALINIINKIDNTAVKYTIIYFPAGSYLFKEQININNHY